MKHSASHSALDQATDVKTLLIQLGSNAKRASHILANASDEQRNRALIAAAESILAHTNAILDANQKDVSRAESEGLTKAFLDRLTLDKKRLDSIASSMREITKLPDPLHRELARWKRPNGLDIARVSVALGVIGIIYESRPNVTADAAALCIKSGNAVILRGGSDSFHSSTAIVNAIREGLERAGLPSDAVQLVSTTDRSAVGEMLALTDYINVIVPRGGKSLTKRVMDESKIPTILHLDGLCHTYVHEKADIKKAVDITLNAKMRRTGICGATETLLIDRTIATQCLPKISDALIAAGCLLRGDNEARKIDARIQAASESDWDTEYLDAILSIKIVAGIEEATSFIEKHGSHHTDAIITEDTLAAEKFLNHVDSAIVMHNASTQFADGGEFGMGAEIGISTGRLHARGPVGVEQLTTYKYVVRGNGQTRA